MTEKRTTYNLCYSYESGRLLYAEGGRVPSVEAFTNLDPSVSIHCRVRRRPVLIITDQSLLCTVNPSNRTDNNSSYSPSVATLFHYSTDKYRFNCDIHWCRHYERNLKTVRSVNGYIIMYIVHSEGSCGDTSPVIFT